MRRGRPAGQTTAMDLFGPLAESLRAHAGAVVAFAAAGAALLMAVWLRRPLLGALAGGIGVLVGWWFTFGLLTATPRQLPERLPLLMLMMVLAAALSGTVARRWPWFAWPGAVLVAALAGWWMAGAPLIVPDVQRAWSVWLGVAAATLLLAGRAAPSWAAAVASGSLLAALIVARLPGPYVVLATALLAAVVAGGLAPRAVRTAPMPVRALPLAAGMAALAVLPLLARGAPADWAIAAAPVAALVLGAPLGVRIWRRAGAPLGAGLAGAACALAAVLLR